MSKAVSLQKRLQQLKKAQADLPKVLYEAAKEATLAAVEAATEATPPKSGRGAHFGTNTLTGELKSHWETDSVTEPEVSSNSYVTQLNNNLEYASYVNDGHRMDRHFVPGLYVSEAGVLEYDQGAKTGLVVGTKTKYVNGEFMADKAKEAYQKMLEAILDEKIGELMK